MKNSVEDLSARARRGQLGESESREFERLLEASLEARLAHRAGLEFDGEDSVLAGDDALAERVKQRLLVPPRRARSRQRRVAVLVVGGICTAVAAAAGPALVGGMDRGWLAFVGVSEPARSAPQEPTATPRPAPKPAATLTESEKKEHSAVAADATEHPVGEEPPATEAQAPTEQINTRRQAKASSSEPTPAAERARDAARMQATNSTTASSAMLFAEASLLRRQGQSGRAMQLYSELLARYPRSREAGSARLALGMLRLQSGAAASALGDFNRYLAQYPGGQLAAEALWGKTRALTALGREAEARRDLLLLVKRYPRSTYATAARAKLGSPH